MKKKTKKYLTIDIPVCCSTRAWMTKYGPHSGQRCILCGKPCNTCLQLDAGLNHSSTSVDAGDVTLRSETCGADCCRSRAVIQCPQGHCCRERRCIGLSVKFKIKQFAMSNDGGLVCTFNSWIWRRRRRIMCTVSA